MEEKLQDPSARVVGSKQVIRAVTDGKAAHVFLGKDAESFLYHRISDLCEEKQVPVTAANTMAELGKLCRVDVPTASAAVLK